MATPKSLSGFMHAHELEASRNPACYSNNACPLLTCRHSILAKGTAQLHRHRSSRKIGNLAIAAERLEKFGRESCRSDHRELV